MRKTPTFRRTARSKMISLQDFPHIHTAVTKIFPRLPLPVQGRDRKILPALRTNQIAGFVTVPSGKKINLIITCYLTKFILLVLDLAAGIEQPMQNGE